MADLRRAGSEHAWLISRHQMQNEQRIALADGYTLAYLAFGAPGSGATCVNGACACDALHRWSWRQPLRYNRRNHQTLLEGVDWMMRR